MRVLYITHDNGITGSTIALLNIIRQMRSFGVECGVIVPSYSGPFYEKLKELDIVTISIGFRYPSFLVKPVGLNFVDTLYQYLRFSCWILKIQYRCYKVIKHFNPDIVHCNNGTIDYGLLGCKLLRIPHVWHFREYQGVNSGFDVFPNMNLLKYKMRQSFNHNIAITKGVYERFDMQDDDKIIYDGVINLDIKHDLRREFPFPYFIYVGTICEGKGLNSILLKFPIFHEEHPDVHLLVVNEYNENDAYIIKCKTTIREGGFDEYVHFIGFRENVYGLMSCAKALIAPSFSEGFGFVVVEAMYNKCLVIGRNMTGIKEQFDRGVEKMGTEIALRFEMDDELPSLMCQAVEDEFSEMKEAAYNMVVENYTVEKNAITILDYYNKVLENF